MQDEREIVREATAKAIRRIVPFTTLMFVLSSRSTSPPDGLPRRARGDGLARHHHLARRMGRLRGAEPAGLGEQAFGSPAAGLYAIFAVTAFNVVLVYGLPLVGIDAGAGRPRTAPRPADAVLLRSGSAVIE